MMGIDDLHLAVKRRHGSRVEVLPVGVGRFVKFCVAGATSIAKLADKNKSSATIVPRSIHTKWFTVRIEAMNKVHFLGTVDDGSLVFCCSSMKVIRDRSPARCRQA